MRGNALPNTQSFEHSFGAGGYRRRPPITVSRKRKPRVLAVDEGNRQRTPGSVPAKGKASGQPIEGGAYDNDIKSLAHDGIKNAHNPVQSRQSLFLT
jgi:hypothetical protein